jgi:Uma2 family endonuclease
MKEVLVRVGDFLRNGIRLVWLVNFEERYLIVFAAGQPPVTVNENEPVPPLPDLPGFTCKVADFFRLPGQPTASNTSA